MKNLLCLCFLFILEISFSQAPLSGIVEYKATISKQTKENYLATKRPKLDNASLKRYDALYLSDIKINATLLFSDEEALFEVDKGLTKTDKDVNYQLIESWAGGSNVFYSNSKLNLNKTQNCKTLGTCFIITSKFKTWQLTQETKIISGYTCYKAIRSKMGSKANKNIIAWYAPSLPVNFGPKGESGLPGLILELNGGSITYNVKKLTLNPKKNITIKQLNKGKEVSEKAYKLLVKKVANNIIRQ